MTFFRIIRDRTCSAATLIRRAANFKIKSRGLKYPCYDEISMWLILQAELLQNSFRINRQKFLYRKNVSLEWGWLRGGTNMGDSPESEVPASWMECSIYQNYTASEVIVQVWKFFLNPQVIGH